MRGRLPRYAALAAVALLVWLALVGLLPGTAHAAPLQLPLPGWLQDMLDQLESALVKTLQDAARVGGVLLWGVLKVCGLVGLFGDDFSALFGTVVTEALHAVVTGSLHNLIRGSLMVSLGLFGLSLLARPFWPDLRLVSFQRAALWGIAIQAYLLNAPTIYTELETWRVDLAEEAANAVSGGAVPGCSGNVVEVLLCITGTSPAEVLDPSLTALPDQIPYGGTESVRDLYDHCVYHPPFLYGNPACNPEHPVGDPWEVLEYAQDALGVQLVSLILALLILAYGVLQIALGLAAGMMFVLFPVAALFAFYLPLESFPAGVIRNYINIFLKSVVLLTLAGVVIRLFSIASGSLAAMAAVALVDLLLCLVMAKEALTSLLGSVSFVGSSVSSLGAAFGLSGGGGAASPLPSPESRVAASMIGGGAVTQTLMGAPHPYGGAQETTLLGAGAAALNAPGAAARSALQAAMAAGTGGAGAVVGALAAERGADYGSLALMGNAATTVLGRSAGRGLVAGAGLAATRQLLTGGESGVDSAASPSGTTSAPAGEPPPARPSLLVPVPPAAPGSSPTSAVPRGRPSLVPADPETGAPATAAPIQALLLGDQTGDPSSPSPAGPGPDSGPDLSGWTSASARQIRQAAEKLEPASPDVENAVFDLAKAGHETAQQWEEEGRSPVLADGRLDPRFVEEVVQQEPLAAATLVAEQEAAHIPEGQRLSLGEAVALGVTTQRTLPARQVRQGLARAVKAAGPEGDLDTALQEELGVGSEAVFGPRAQQAGEVVQRMQQAGLANDLGRQLVETVGEVVERNPQLTPQRFREGRLARMHQWDQATDDPETTDRIVEGLIGLGAGSEVPVREIPWVAESAPPLALETLSPPESEPSIETAARPRLATPPVQEQDAALFERLRSWRLQAAGQSGQKAFYVFPDATLQRIATARPQTLEELQAVKGVGPKKLEQYGQAVLDITRDEGGKEA